MGRAPCCDKANVKRGPWCPEEDQKLKDFIEKHGTGGNWIALPHKAGLKRCGKSCRLRWLNYLRPNIKHGEFSDAEDRTICSLYATIGSRWSIIAQNLQGRTDNDIKNYWNTKLKKKMLGISTSQRKQNISQHHFHQHPIFQQEPHHQFQQQLFPTFQNTNIFAPSSSSLPFQIPSNSLLPNQIPAAETFSISHMDVLNSVSGINTTSTLFQDTRLTHNQQQQQNEQQHQYPMKHEFGGEAADSTQKNDFESNGVATEGNDLWKTIGFESLLSINGLDEDKKYLLSTDLESSDVPLLETGGSLNHHESDRNNNIDIPSTWSVEESPLVSYSDFDEIKRLITSTSSSIHGCNNIFLDEDPSGISISKPKEEEGGGGRQGHRSRETPMYNYY